MILTCDARLADTHDASGRIHDAIEDRLDDVVDIDSINGRGTGQNARGCWVGLVAGDTDSIRLTLPRRGQNEAIVAINAPVAGE